MTDTQKMLDEHVRDIAEMLNEFSDSYFYWDIDTEEPDDNSDSNYFDDIYGLTCYLDMFDKSVDGYSIMIACGGPNIYVDTKACGSKVSGVAMKPTIRLPMIQRKSSISSSLSGIRLMNS